MDEGSSMRSVFWLVIGAFALIIAHAILRTTYRIIRGTVSDTLFLALLAGAALAARYLFSYERIEN
jgi:hypothetical protein